MGSIVENMDRTRIPKCEMPRVRDIMRMTWENISVRRAMMCMNSRGESMPNPLPVKERAKSSDSCSKARIVGSANVGTSSRTRCSICLYSI